MTPDRELTQGRLLLCQALPVVLRNGLTLLGVSAPEQMAAPEAEDAAGPAGA